ncbi:hypothetical protein PR202_gb24011 [Eleusine coracana subsp. coracana]|uniref:RRM domain-containing protein n=1 Tax=Eleusine coracana subsp. coracana TaxID=191504 RepID=A0AAV5FHN5_ELECO|nr:hypothetical protein PR202_gb24011 [Eleusine coracana subsp. coracana]
MDRVRHENFCRAVAEDNTALLLKAVEAFRKEALGRIRKGSEASRTLDHEVSARLLHLACKHDAVQCARLLLEGGGSGLAPAPVDARDKLTRTPLHVAAETHSARCIELLLSKNARVDLRVVDGQPLLPLEIALMSRRVQVQWSPDKSIEDLLAFFNGKDLTAVRLLAEKTRVLGELAYRYAMEGRVPALAMLLLVVEEKISGLVSVVIEGVRTKRSIYNSIVDEALSLGDAPARDGNERRKALLCEIQLLNQFGSASWRAQNDKRTLVPLLRAAKVGDMNVIKMLLMGNVDVNEVDSEGNTALHWCLSGISSKQEPRIVWLLLKNGARVFQGNKLGLTPVHSAAAKGNYKALQKAETNRIGNNTGHAFHSKLYKSGTIYMGHKKSACQRDFRSSNHSAHGPKGKGQFPPKQGSKFSPRHNHWLRHDYTRKIFVGGLPPSVDSEYLIEFFTAEFGPVEEAVVIGLQIGNRVQSRGFGFVKFEREKDVLSAKEAHHVYMLGKRVEIKDAVARAFLPAEDQRASARKYIQEFPEVNHSPLDGELIEEYGPQKRRPLPEKCLPSWFFIFRKWLPGFLSDETERLGERMCVVPVGSGPATHMVLLPPFSRPKYVPLLEPVSFDHDELPESVSDNHSPRSPLNANMTDSPHNTDSQQGDASSEANAQSQHGDESSRSNAESQKDESSTGSLLDDYTVSTTWTDLVESEPTRKPDLFISVPTRKHDLVESGPTVTSNLIESGPTKTSSLIESGPTRTSNLIESGPLPQRNESGPVLKLNLLESVPTRKLELIESRPTACFIDCPVERPAVTPSSRETDTRFSFFQSQWDKYLTPHPKIESCIICRSCEAGMQLVPCLHKICIVCMMRCNVRACMICGTAVSGVRSSPAVDPTYRYMGLMERVSDQRCQLMVVCRGAEAIVRCSPCMHAIACRGCLLASVTLLKNCTTCGYMIEHFKFV